MDEQKASFNYFPVCGDVNPVRQRADRIERMFSVKVNLGQQCPKTKNTFVYPQGLKRDMCNARAYIQSLVLSNNSIYTREKTVYLPSSITDDVIERVERKSTAAIIHGRDAGVYFLRGSDISVNTAMTMLEELVSEAQPPSLPQTPVKPNKASRRLSSALYETLTKRHTRENYNNVANAVKRAIASCIMEDTIIEDESAGKSEDDKNKDDEAVDYILIEDDSFQINEPGIQEVDDSDLMIIETPRKPTAKDDEDQVFFGETFDGARTAKAVDKLTDAFGELKTPSKPESSVIKQDITGAKPKACVKPHTSSTLNNKNKELTEIKDTNERVRNVDTTIDGRKIDDDDKKKKDRKKSRSEKEEKKARHKRKLSENVEEFTSKQSKLLQEAVNGSNGNVPKRRRLKSTVADDVKKTNGMSEKSEITSDANKHVTDDAIYRDRDRKSQRANKRRKSHRSSKKKKSRWNSRDRRSRSKDRRDACSPPKQPHESVCSYQTPRNNSLRYIVVDGSNVAMSHGGNRGVFSCKGIRLCVDFFQRRGHSLITVFLPRWRQYRPADPNSVTGRYILDELEKEGVLVYTPSRRIGNRLVASYDDRFIIELAEREDGIVVSNDEYRDLKTEKSSWRHVIENRLLMYSWVRDHFMVPEDPLGRYGPNLTDFLRHPSNVNKMDAYPVMSMPSYKSQPLVMPNILRTVNFTYDGTGWQNVVRT